MSFNAGDRVRWSSFGTTQTYDGTVDFLDDQGGYWVKYDDGQDHWDDGSCLTLIDKVKIDTNDISATFTPALPGGNILPPLYKEAFGDELTAIREDDEIGLADWERELLFEAGTFDGKVRALFREAAELLLSKHRDYGPLNIAHSPGGPVNGLRVRLHDKLARLNHLTDTSADPEHESLEDTWRDIVGYGAIGLLVSRGDWPGE